jgi:small nuclear ribonucleoprotein (snRNP)-like protein
MLNDAIKPFVNEEVTIHLTTDRQVIGTLVGFDNIWLNVDTVDGSEAVCIYSVVRVVRGSEVPPLQFD